VTRGWPTANHPNREHRQAADAGWLTEHQAAGVAPREMGDW
jgi:hypothetical protein